MSISLRMVCKVKLAALFNDLEKYVGDPERRWIYCLRVKRGQEDTRYPYSFWKDQVYLKGSMELLKRRAEIDFPLLYSGKVALEDLPIVSTLATREVMRLPCFLKNEREYRRHLDSVAEANGMA